MIRHQIVIPLLGFVSILVLLLVFLPQEQSTGDFSVLAGYQPMTSFALPDLSNERNIHRRKVRFFEYLLPVVQNENLRLADIRQRLVYIQEHDRLGHQLSTADQTWLVGILVEFRLSGMAERQEQFWTELYLRVDQIPETLVLVQAANESAWGTSRFAREGNNLFGQWCFSPGCGMVPEGRPEGEIYEVARFTSVSHAVAAYMRNLNTGRSYEGLRKKRARSRREGKLVSAADLAKGLVRYSQRGEEYISELLVMLRINSPIIEEIRSPGPDKPEA